MPAKASPVRSPAQIMSTISPANVTRAAPRGMRATARSMVPLSRCGPGTRTMQGQTRISRRSRSGLIHAASTPTIPADRAARNGGIRELMLMRAAPRRNNAPRAALSAMTNAVARSASPKITPRATAPAAARQTKRSRETGGSCSIDLSAARASAASMRSISTLRRTSSAAATLRMSMPDGSARRIRGATWTSV